MIITSFVVILSTKTTIITKFLELLPPANVAVFIDHCAVIDVDLSILISQGLRIHLPENNFSILAGMLATEPWSKDNQTSVKGRKKN